MVTRISDSNGIEIEVLSSGANALAKENQIPTNAFNVRTLLMLQDDVADEENSSLMQRARAGGATTFLNIRSEKTLHSIGAAADFIVVSETFKTPDNFKGVLILNNNEEAIVQFSDRKSIFSEIPYPSTNFNKSIAEDFFCGAFASCLQAGGDIKSALGYARVTGYLAGSTGATREKFPYLDEITAMFQKKNSRKLTA